MLGLALLFLAIHPTGHQQVPRHTAHHAHYHHGAVCPGATHFYEKHHPAPYWAKDMVVVCVIQDHIFFREQTPAERKRAALVVMGDSPQ